MVSVDLASAHCMIHTSIIILSYNTKDLLTQCLTSLYDHLPNDAEVIVVDNASSDGSVSMVKKDFPRAHVVQNDRNLGFGLGIMSGVKKSNGKYLLFLNSDAMIKDDGLGKMIQFMDSDSQIGVLGGLLLNDDGSQQRSFGSFYTLPSVFLMLVGGDRMEMGFDTLNREGNQENKTAFESDWVSGGFMLIRREIFDTINGFDKQFFMYIEDMELCYRVKQSGYKVFVFPQATVVHRGQGSSNRSFAIQHIYRGLRYFYKKHRPAWEYVIVNGLLLTKASLLVVLGTITRNHYLVDTYKQCLSAK